MATSSFFSDIKIKDKKTAMNFLKAMENSEKAPKKRINIKYNTIKDKDKIRELFLR